MPTYFAKLTLTRRINSAFHPHPNEVNTCPVYLKEDIFVRGQYHKFQQFFAIIYFSNFNNSQIILVTISKKIIPNFQLNFSKSPFI